MAPQSLACRLGAVAVLVAGAVHLELWLGHGYRSIHVIGPLFLANAAGAALIAAALLLRPGAVAAATGVLFASSTLGAFLLSVYVGLFGFTEALRGTPQVVAGVAELAAIALLAVPAARGLRRSGVEPRAASAIHARPRRAVARREAAPSPEAHQRRAE